MKTLLITGLPNSGTSLLAAMIARHSEVNMLFEDLGENIYKLYGKQYAANKLCYHYQIRNTQSANKFTYLINRLLKPFLKYNYYPISKLTIHNFDKIISIHRNLDANVMSFLTRNPKMDFNFVKEKFYKLDQQLWKLAGFHITLHELTTKPAQTMQSICKYLQLAYETEMLNGYKYNYHKQYKKLESKI